MKELDEKTKALLEKYPHYTGEGEYCGTREYYEAVFEKETNRDPELHKAFTELHTRLVNEVIKFCKEHDLQVDEFYIGADGLLDSKKYGEWIFSTDSYMSMFVRKDNMQVDRDEPFLHSI